MINILYIHGFASSSSSLKAQQSQTFFAKYPNDVHYVCPDLHVSPAKAMSQLIDCINTKPDEPWCLIGSSLGGYYATYLVEKFQFTAVIVNPAVKPYILLKDYMNGSAYQHYHTGEQLELEPSFIDELISLEKPVTLKNNYTVMLQTGDEVLDYQEAEKKYQQCHVITEKGGDHSFINFHHHLPDIMNFFGVNPL